MFNSSWFRVRGEAATAATIAGMDAMPASLDASPGVPDVADDAVRVIYASETGVTEHFATDACHALRDAGVPFQLVPFDELDLDALQAVGSALFLVSTCQDGDPPDMAEKFWRERMQHPASLSRLRYGMLALGDSYYDEFCGFGRRLDQWLRASGAKTWFERVEMDNEDEVAARRWHDRMGSVIKLRRNAGGPTT
ncbi:MAG: flavodoxin domain-containing protein [Rhodanobacter sp.]